VSPGEEGELSLRVHLVGGALTASVTPLDGIDDAVSADDRAVLVAPPAVPPRVMLVHGEGEGDADSAGRFFARRALEASGIEAIHEVTAAEAHAATSGHDLAIVLGEGPSRTLDIPTLYLATSTGSLPVEPPRELLAAETALRSIDERAAVMRGVRLDGVSISRALALDVPSDGRGLVELDGGTVIAVGGVGQRRWVYVGIDPIGSDLVLRVAFPVLVANALTSLRGVDTVAVAETTPRSEVVLAAGALPVAVTEADAPGLSLPASPPVWLATFAAFLLMLELVSWRRGWA
jgi:hypothetical protein